MNTWDINHIEKRKKKSKNKKKRNLENLEGCLLQQESLKSWNKSAPIGQKEPLWHTKTKAKARNTLGERNTMRQNREESKSKTKVAARDKPHGEGKKKKPKARNREKK